MAASSASDIPESKSDYCPCNRCGVARKEGRQEILKKLSEIVFKYGEGIGMTMTPMKVFEIFVERNKDE